MNISEEQCNIKGEGNYIDFVYPMVLNYYLSNIIYININYYLDSSYYEVPDIILNSDSKKLNCYDINNKIKRCTVSKSHFDGKKEGYYPILYFNYLNNLTTVYQISPIQVILPKENDIIIKIKIEDNTDIEIEPKGILYLITNFEDTNNTFNDTYIYFNSTIKDDSNNKYNVNCKLWIPKNEKLRIICKLNENFKDSRQKISLNKVEFIYNNYNVMIFQQDYLEVEQLNYEISFLYSEQQKIEIKEEIESYNLKFYIEKYNDEPLYIYGQGNNYIFLDNCKKNENELNCEISKEKIKERLIKNNEQFKVRGINDTIGVIDFKHISNIIINYKIDKKEDIYIKLDRLLLYQSFYGQEGTPTAIETNITNIPNIISDITERCYFKKNKDSPLLYLCNFQEDDWQYNIDKEIIMNDLHYKYNFRIQPNSHYLFQMKSHGTSFNLVYPEILNFKSEELLTIRFIASDLSLTKNIKFASDSKYLECEDLNGFKKCIVTIGDFIAEKTEYYYLNQKNENKDEECKESVHYELSPIKVIFPENMIEIYINDEDNEEDIIIGKNGFFSFVTNYTDDKNIFDIYDIEEKTYFNTTISKYINEKEFFYKVTCRLWKPKNDTIRLLCKLNEEISYGEIKLYSAFVSYKEYKIELISKMSFKTYVKKIYENIPTLYSDKQEINIKENKQYYELNFTIKEYNNELLFLKRKEEKKDKYLSGLILEDCNIEGKDLTCKIEKEKIIENLYYNGEIFELDFYSAIVGPLKFQCVLDIIINYNISIKEDIYVGINILLQNNLDFQNYIPYETNITSISNLITDFFDYETNIDSFSCRFKKSTNYPLLFLCIKINPEAISSLGENKTEVVLDNIHAKYNFRIQPVNRPEEFYMKNEGSKIIYIYPNNLNYTKNDLISINFIMSKPENTKGIRLNPDSEELDCVYPDNYIKRCLVPKSHFDEKKSGYYYIYYLNAEKKLNIFYDISPIFISLPEEYIIININKENNTNTIIIGNKGTMAFITDYYDHNNIFNSSDIEENTKFKAEFIGNKSYNANCRLWKPKNNSLRMICKFDENLENGNIKINTIISEYKGKKFYIYSEDIFNVEQLNVNIAFLYSDKQEINIENNKDSYEIFFKKDSYYNEPLMLYNNKMKIINLECNEREKQIICSVKKNKILELLSFNGENYCLGQLIDLKGLYKFNSVLNITINYSIEKKDIYINITRLLTSFLEINNFISYETNISDIIKISTDYFNLTTEKNNNLECILKKNDEKLLLLCEALVQGKGSIGKITKIKLNNLNILYNFIIIDSKNEEEYVVSDKEGTMISLIYPEDLNFTSKESYNIIYITDFPERFEDIKLNSESPDVLNCENKKGFKQCIVPKNHFNEEGYYYTYYNNSFGNESIAYEVSTVKIILKQNGTDEPESDKSDEPDNSKTNLIIIISVSVFVGLALIAIIVFFAIKYYRKKKFIVDGYTGKDERIVSNSSEVE